MTRSDRHGWEAPPRPPRRARGARGSSAGPAARSTRSARGRSCRTGPPRSGAGGAGPRSQPALGGEQPGHPGHEVVEVRDLREHVVGDDEVGAVPRPTSSSAQRGVEEPDERPDPGAMATSATFAAGSIPSTGTPSPTNCRSRYPSLLPSSTTSSWAEAALAVMRSAKSRRAPASCRVRREVRVLREDLGRRNVRRQLHQEAHLADHRPER